MRWLLLILAAAPSSWADLMPPTLTFGIPNGYVWVGPARPSTGASGYQVNVPYLMNPVTTVTSSNTPLNSGVTRPVEDGGGFRDWSGSLVASDATHWYFGVPQVQDMLIEDGIDLDNDGRLDGPYDIGGFSLLTFSVGTSTIARAGSEFILTMQLEGLDLDCFSCDNPPLALDSYFGLASSTEWSGLLTLTFTDETGALNFNAGWGGPATGELVYTATPEPTSIVFLGTVVIGLSFALKRRFSPSSTKPEGSTL